MERKKDIGKVLGLDKLFTVHSSHFTIYNSRFFCASRSLLHFTLYALLLTVFLLFYALPVSTFAGDKLVVRAPDGQTKKFVVSDTGKVEISNNPTSGTGGDHVRASNSTANSYTTLRIGENFGSNTTDETGYLIYWNSGWNNPGYGYQKPRSFFLQAAGGVTNGFNFLTYAPNAPIVFWNNTGTSVSPIWYEAINIKAGKVGIGETDPQHLLHLKNGAYSDGYTWENASSREYKENIRNLTIEEAFLAINKLNPVKFNYKGDREKDRLGFIAEDVPNLVASKDRKGLSSMDIVAVLTMVVQEQQKVISDLSEKINEIEKLIK